MQQLLIVAHGSRREASNQEVRSLGQQVATQLQLASEQVQVAFLELTTPSVATALDQCFQRGVNQVTVLPYFLSSGNHVVKDLPQEIAAVQENWPNKHIKLLPHIGAIEGMVHLIASAYRGN